MQVSPLPSSQGLVLRKPYSSQAVCSEYTTNTPSSSLATELLFFPLPSAAGLEQHDGNMTAMPTQGVDKKNTRSVLENVGFEMCIIGSDGQSGTIPHASSSLQHPSGDLCPAEDADAD